MSIRQYSSDEFKYFLVRLRGFQNIEMPCIQLPDGRHFWPISAIAEDVLHVNKQRQIQRLRYSGTTAPLIETFEIKTPQGMRQALFLEFSGLAHWLQLLNPKKMVDNPIATRLELFQRAALRAVNEILHGDIQPVPPQLAGPDDQKLTMNSLSQRLDTTDERVTRIQDIIERQSFTYVDDNDEEGIISVVFPCECGRRHVARFQQLPWKGPQIIDVQPFDDGSDSEDEEE